MVDYSTCVKSPNSLPDVFVTTVIVLFLSRLMNE